MLREIAADEFEKGGGVWNKGRGLRNWGLRSRGSSVEMAEAMRRAGFCETILKS